MSTTTQPTTDALVRSITRARELLTQVDELEQRAIDLEVAEQATGVAAPSGVQAGDLARQLEALGDKLDSYIEITGDAVYAAHGHVGGAA